MTWRNGKCYPSEPGLEGELSEEMEVTEATDRGLWEEGMVKERTMDGGRGPRRSSAGGWWSTKKRKEKLKFEKLLERFYFCTDTGHIHWLYLRTFGAILAG